MLSSLSYEQSVAIFSSSDLALIWLNGLQNTNQKLASLLVSETCGKKHVLCVRHACMLVWYVCVANAYACE